MPHGVIVHFELKTEKNLYVIYYTAHCSINWVSKNDCKQLASGAAKKKKKKNHNLNTNSK